MAITNKDGADRGDPIPPRTALDGRQNSTRGAGMVALLVEHHAGVLPVWLAPVQAVVIPVTGRNLGYAREVRDRLVSGGLRVGVDERPERMDAKIRDAQLQKVPYMLVVGNREEAKGVSVRLRTNEDRGVIGLSSFFEELRTAVGTKDGP